MVVAWIIYSKSHPLLNLVIKRFYTASYMYALIAACNYDDIINYISH